MPVYDYRCKHCGSVETHFVKLAKLDETAFFHCSEQMDRVISAPMVVPDYAPYNCPITGREIRGRREHIENLARTGCRVKEPGETEEFIRRKNSGYFQKQFEAANEKVFNEAFRELGFNV